MFRGLLPSERTRICVASAIMFFMPTFSARAGEDNRTTLEFLDQLRRHGYHDLAIDYLRTLRADTSVSTEIKAGLDFEEGKTLLDESARTGDLVRRRELLDQARVKLESFTKNHSDHPAAREAYVQLARMMVEHGHVAMILAEEAKDPAEKESKLAQARTSFDQARQAYVKAVEKLDAEYKAYGRAIPESDPRYAPRNKVHSALLDAMLQRAEVDYEQAQTYPEGSAERKKLLDQALVQFDSLHKNYRTIQAGLTAQMWQAKCYEDQGKLDEAIGLYKGLLEHVDPQLRTLQLHVGSFYIEALGKRKQYALAADEAVLWLETYNRPEEQRSERGLRVRFELAKNIDLQMPEIAQADRPKAVNRITDSLMTVVKYASPFKPRALELLKKYKPSAALKAEEISKLSHEEASIQAEDALNAHEWERAVALFNAALRKIDVVAAADKAVMTRYNLAYAYFMNKQYFEAFVLADHLARRYPKAALAPKATVIGMHAMTESYNTYREIDRVSDLDRLVDMARYTVETWPDRDEADDARINLGIIAQGRGRYEEAVEAFGSVRDRSSRWADAQTQLGVAHWSLGRMDERSGDQAAGAAESKKAVEILQGALKTRRDAGTSSTDPNLIGNACELAFVLTELGKPADALAILEPIVKDQTVKSGPSYTKLMESLLRARIAANQVDQAIVVMQILEKAGGGSNQQTQNYYRLGRLIQKELDRLRQTKNAQAEERMRQAYRTFLTSLAKSKTGQTYESLQWAGESLLTLGADAEAEALFRRILDEPSGDSASIEPEVAKRRFFQTRLKLAAALRGLDKFDEAEALVDQLKTDEPRSVFPRFEAGMLLEARAAAKQGSWNAAYQHWQKLAQQLAPIRPRPLVYYDAWYHAAHALNEDHKGAKARQTLAGVMKLSPSVGGPEMKSKYEDLLARIK
jgi:tetratricopeptide (TPR) repeat protein